LAEVGSSSINGPVLGQAGEQLEPMQPVTRPGVLQLKPVAEANAIGDICGHPHRIKQGAAICQLGRDRLLDAVGLGS
jgi:hypothetical protein